MFGAFGHFLEGATRLELALAAIGGFTLLTAMVSWALRSMRGAAQADPKKPAARPEGWAGDGTIVFPGGRDAGRARFEVPPPRAPEESSPLGSLLGSGVDGIAERGEHLIDAVREHPLQFVLGALAAGFAAGMIVPLFSMRERSTRLLERLLEVNEELRDRRNDERREPEFFRQARPK